MAAAEVVEDFMVAACQEAVAFMAAAFRLAEVSLVAG